MYRTTISVLSAGILSGVVFALSGCYTVEGAGRDVAATGAGLSAGAEEMREHSAQAPGPSTEQRKRR